MHLNIQELIINMPNDEWSKTLLSGLIGGALTAWAAWRGISKSSELDRNNRRYDAIYKEYFQDTLDLVKTIETGSKSNNSYLQIINLYRNADKERLTKTQLNEDIEIMQGLDKKLNKLLNYGKNKKLIKEIKNENHILLNYIEFLAITNGIGLFDSYIKKRKLLLIKIIILLTQAVTNFILSINILRKRIKTNLNIIVI